MQQHGTIPGSVPWVRPATAQVAQLSHWVMMDPAQKAASSALHRKRKADNLPATACADRPAYFDGPARNESLEHLTRRVEIAVEYCMDCPLFVQCDAVRKAEPAPDGIYAGRLYGEAVIVQQVNARLRGVAA